MFSWHICFHSYTPIWLWQTMTFYFILMRTVFEASFLSAVLLIGLFNFLGKYFITYYVLHHVSFHVSNNASHSISYHLSHLKKCTLWYKIFSTVLSLGVRGIKLSWCWIELGLNFAINGLILGRPMLNILCLSLVLIISRYNTVGCFEKFISLKEICSFGDLSFWV